MAQSIEITADTPIDDHLIKRRGHLIKLGQVVFGIDGTAVVRSLTQFKTNAQLADVIDAKRSPLFSVMDYSNFVKKGDTGWTWPTADEALSILDERMTARDAFMQAFEANAEVASEDIQTFLATFWSRGELTKIFDHFVSTGELPKEAIASAEKVPTETKEVEVTTKKSGKGISDLPKLAELRKEAERMGVDISDLGRKRSAIYARLQDCVVSNQAPPDLHVMPDEPEPVVELMVEEPPPILLHEPPLVENEYIEELPVFSDSAVLQDSVDDLKDELGRIQTALRGIVGYLDTLKQSQDAMVELFVKDGFLNEGGSLPSVDGNIRNDLSALAGIEDRFGLVSLEEEPHEDEPEENGSTGLIMPSRITEIEQSLVEAEPEARQSVAVESDASVLDKIKDGYSPQRDELRALELEELRNIAGHLGVPDPHTKVYKQGLIRQIISLIPQ